jgi:hypothetical protein
VKKLVALLIVAVALGWGALALNVDGDPAPTPGHKPIASDDDQDAIASDAPTRNAPTMPRAKTTPALEPQANAVPEAPGNALPAVAPGPETRPDDPEFEARSRLYANEPRDGTWATKHEARMAEMLESPETPTVAHVHCRTTVCRITVDGGAPRDLARILARPGVREATGLDESSPYAFEAGAFTLYYKRTGDLEPTLP